MPIVAFPLHSQALKSDIFHKGYGGVFDAAWPAHKGRKSKRRYFSHSHVIYKKSVTLLRLVHLFKKAIRIG